MLELGGQRLTLEMIDAVGWGREQLSLAPESRDRIERSRQVVETVLSRDDVVYGVNTGFGKLADVRIPASELGVLQLNLVRSHACGVGPPLSPEETRALMLLRANVPALGFSGCRVGIVETLLKDVSGRRVTQDS
jgi:histidine ammonia-lyase